MAQGQHQVLVGVQGQTVHAGKDQGLLKSLFARTGQIGIALAQARTLALTEAMQFLNTDGLWALLLAPLVLGLYLLLLRRTRRHVMVFSSLALVREAQGPASHWRRHLPSALVFVALVLSLLALARPVARVTLPADYMTLVLAMDVSRSMLADDVEPNRIEAAQKAAREFLQELPPQRARGHRHFCRHGAGGPARE